MKQASDEPTPMLAHPIRLGRFFVQCQDIKWSQWCIKNVDQGKASFTESMQAGAKKLIKWCTKSKMIQ